MRVLIFGTGEYYQNRKNSFKDVEIVAFLDNDINKQNFLLDGHRILSPQIGLQEKYDCIYVMSSLYEEQMKQQLLDLGISEKIIYGRRELSRLQKQKKIMIYYENTQLDGIIGNRAGMEIALISHEMSLSGAPIVLLYAAQILKKNGYFVVVVSVKDGPLRERFISSGIPVIIDENLDGGTLKENQWLRRFDLIFVNTLVLSYLLKERFFSVPVIWWIHEASEWYGYVDQKNLKNMRLDNDLSIYAAGNKALDIYIENTNNFNVNNLPFGIPDTKIEKNINSCMKEKLVFAIIGSIIPRKAQDVFVEAIQSFTENEREIVEFWIIGTGKKQFSDAIMLKGKNIPQLKFLGEIDHQELVKKYAEIDILVCPSREEPTSIVSLEAMLNQKVCIVSKATGISEFIQDKKNGLICETGDAKSLAEKLKWVMDHRDKLEEIGVEARKIYDRHFSMECFEKSIMSIVNEKICSFNDRCN